MIRKAISKIQNTTSIYGLAQKISEFDSAIEEITQLLLNQGILSSPSPRKLEDAQCIMFYSFQSACIPSLFFQLWYFTTLRLKSEFHRYLKQIPYHQYLSKYIRILASNSSSGLKLGWFEIGSRPESVEMPRSSATPILRAK